MALDTGKILHNRYRIVKKLAQGGFGAIYRAWDINLKHPCAIKENLETSPAAQQQFIREARVLANLSHPNLPRVTDYFAIQAQGQYLVMDYIEGEDLQEKLDRSAGPLPIAQVLDWINQICDALTYLHGQNPAIIHRDIKPANIKITPAGQAMLVDFGISKVYEPHLQTTRGARAVTPGFSPVEQYGQSTTDARSDIYALGATLYAVLTGYVPPESIQRVVDDTLVPPQSINTHITPATASVIMRSMQLEPQNRFQRAAEINASLTVPTAPAVVMPTARAPVIQPSVVEQTAPAPRGIPWGWIGGVTGLAVVIVLLVVFVFKDRFLSSEPTQSASIPAEVVAVLASDTPPVETITPTPTRTPAPTLTSTRTTAPEPAHIQVEPTSTPPPTLSPTRLEPPMLVLDVNSNCRGGPDAGYEILRTMTKGTILEILGRNNTSQWILIKIDDPSTRKKLCWIHHSNGHISGDSSLMPVCSWIGDGYTENQRCTTD